MKNEFHTSRIFDYIFVVGKIKFSYIFCDRKASFKNGEILLGNTVRIYYKYIRTFRRNRHRFVDNLLSTHFYSVAHTKPFIRQHASI